MKKKVSRIPKFKTYEEEARFWGYFLDTLFFLIIGTSISGI